MPTGNGSAPPRPLCPRPQFAQYYGVSVRQLRRLGGPVADPGDPSRHIEAGIDVREWCDWERSRGRVVEHQADELDERRERARLLRAQADAQETKNRIAAGEWGPVEPILAGLGALFSELRTRLMAIPTAAAPRVIGLNELPLVQAVIDDAIRDALSSLDPATVFRRAGLATLLDAAAETDDLGVGEEIPETD